MENRQKMMLYGSIAVISICIIALFYTIYVYFIRSDPPSSGMRPQVDKVYYFDLTTNKLFAGDPQLTPPIPAPDQPAGNPKGVRAYVYACDDCAKQWIGWLERYKPKAKALMENPPVGGYNAAQLTTIKQGREVRAETGTDKAWVSAGTQQALDLKNKALKGRCPEKRPKSCHPSVIK